MMEHRIVEQQINLHGGTLEKSRWFMVAICLLTFTQGAHAATTLTFGDNTSPSAVFPQSPHNLSHPGGFHHDTAMGSGAELRLIDPTGNEGGGPPQLPGKDVFSGGEQWLFDSANLMSGVSGTPSNAGAATAGSAPENGSSAAPLTNTNPTISQETLPAGAIFSFLAPTTSSLAGAAYGAASINLNLGTSELQVLFPVLELQWGNAWHPLGGADNDNSGAGDGVTFFGSITNVISCGFECNTFDFRLFAEETFDNIVTGDPGAGGVSDEDPIDGSFGGGGGWTFQWEVVGSGLQTSAVPVPATIWLFGSGLIGLLGFARRRKTSNLL